MQPVQSEINEQPNPANELNRSDLLKLMCDVMQRRVKMPAEDFIELLQTIRACEVPNKLV